MSSSTHSIILVDTIALLHSCVDALAGSTSIAVDLEGIDLCRSGRLSLVQLMAEGSNTIWLVDVAVLGRSAFEDVAPSGQNLKAILESRSIKKLFFDVRNDSDALYNLFGVTLANVYDLQLLELAARTVKVGRPPRFISGLAATLETYLAPLKSFAIRRQWKNVKEAGKKLFAPECGGRYEVFEERPLVQALVEYCAQDVALLHELDGELHRQLGVRGRGWDERVLAESDVRVGVAKQAHYVPNGPHKALVPKYW
ncbi:ribonuclease H-like domain-containing protein [Roridomyces roridus]|uniref:Ribonuclease H-like domain-containing protein n=1 Tax=Roridomyces roridus TaxID=1738132 RepID=A0AAD7BI07_9AGAR|nr:ribonuclease H-like domain-containing protein [Roridomyces roridus]